MRVKKQQIELGMEQLTASKLRMEYNKYVNIFPTVLIPACGSSRLAFPMMYSEYKLNKQGDNIQPCCTPFQVLNQSVVLCLVLIVAF